MALIPVDILSVVTEGRGIIALVAALISTPIPVNLGLESFFSTSVDYVGACIVGDIRAVSHNLSAVASPCVVIKGSILETSVDAAIHTLLADVLVNNPVVLTNGVSDVAVIKAICLS